MFLNSFGYLPQAPTMHEMDIIATFNIENVEIICTPCKM